MTFLLVVAVVFGIARFVAGVSGRLLLRALLALWIAILAVHSLPLLLGMSAPLLLFDMRMMIGGTLWSWLVAGGVLLLVIGYGSVLARLRRAAHTPPTPAPDTLSPAEIERYARHLVLRDIGGPGQMRLKQARVLVVGAGGLGSPVCLYLAAAGVGQITVADDDRVSVSNLQRQVIFRDDDHGRGKARTAAAAMAALNPHIHVTALDRRITEADRDLIAPHDLVIDGTDSFASRATVNAACAAAGVPLVAGSIAQWDGQVTIYDPARGAPCMACVFPHAPSPGQATPCAEAGVVGALPGIIGSIMAMEAIKLITGAGDPLRERMLILDALHGETRTVRLARQPGCPVCGSSSPSQ